MKTVADKLSNFATALANDYRHAETLCEDGHITQDQKDKINAGIKDAYQTIVTAIGNLK